MMRIIWTEHENNDEILNKNESTNVSKHQKNTAENLGHIKK